jgi:UDP-glucose 4-epimerase
VKVLVVGGAGYVGGSTCAHLIDQGHSVWVLDDLSTGHRELALGDGFTQARAGDRAPVGKLLREQRFDCVMHFAAKSLAGESVQKPQEYRENNVVQTRELLETMLECGARRFVFSSTCAIFGDPGEARIHEELPKKPINPYGETKLEVERMLREYAARGLQSVALRYFNAAGAEPGGRVGEWHDHETHLIPNVLFAALDGRPVSLFGTDYPTPDGTCIRDYVPIWELARAHEAAAFRLLQKPAEGGSFEAFNLGSESGFSVREVVKVCEKVTGRAIQVNEQPRRAGDPPRLVADSALARRELGFQSKASLEEIVASAYRWELKRRAVFSRDRA